MKKLLLWMVALVPFSCAVLHAQGAPVAKDANAKDVTGAWQGTLQAGKPLRIVLKITKGDAGAPKAVFYSIDQTGQPFTVSAFTVQGSNVKLAVSMIGGAYEGKISADGNAITGTWTQGSSPLPLNFTRATAETAWEIPPPPAPLKLMAPDADPSFDVATIKPNNSGAVSMQGLTVNGRNFATRNSSLVDLICFAYQVQAKQIVGGPDWMDKDRYDIAAVPDKEGAPNPAQVRLMIQKLLAERFKLKFHHDQRELSAFVLTAAKTGPKLKSTELTGPLPGIGMRPGPGGITLMVRNATIADFSGFLQSLVLDRPVVNQTALSGKFDFEISFTPDDTQFNGHPPQLPPATDATNTFPSLFEAMQQQIGLKLEAKKTPVDVLALDHVDKPSEN